MCDTQRTLCKKKGKLAANVVKISLSVWDQTSYEQVNRPHPDLRFDQLIEGQTAFRVQFKRQLVFLLGLSWIW